MKRIPKGEAGYLDYKKKVEIIRTVLYFSLVAAIFFLGYSQAHSRNNLLTVVAVLGCLPSAKSLVGVIMRLPHTSVRVETTEEINSVADKLTIVYDLVLTSREKVIPIESILILENQVLGYVRNPKVDTDHGAEHIHSMLSQNGQDKVTIKMLCDYALFLAKAKELNALAGDRKGERKQEKQIKGVILNLSL